MVEIWIYQTDAWKFGIFMLSYGIVIGAVCAWGAMRFRLARKRDELLQELESP